MRRRARRGRRLAAMAFLLALFSAAGFGLATVLRTDDGSRVPVAALPALPAIEADNGTPLPPTAVSLAGPDAFHLKLKDPPAGGLVFDLRGGDVLWRHRPMRSLPVASLTKIMTALLVAERTGPRERVKIRRSALDYEGQGVGLADTVGRRVPIEALLHGALLTSGNDAALALADHVSGSRGAFVRVMNRRARELGLSCTHFVSPHGIEPGNRSCAADLAALARLSMGQERIARVVKRNQAAFRFPIRGGRLDLSTTNPLLLTDYPGTIGLKTGYTEEAGRCLVGVVRRRGRTLAVVLLDSPDPNAQARQLLDRAFRSRSS